MQKNKTEVNLQGSKDSEAVEQAVVEPIITEPIDIEAIKAEFLKKIEALKSETINPEPIDREAIKAEFLKKLESFKEYKPAETNETKTYYYAQLNADNTVAGILQTYNEITTETHTKEQVDRMALLDSYDTSLCGKIYNRKTGKFTVPKPKDHYAHILQVMPSKAGRGVVNKSPSQVCDKIISVPQGTAQPADTVRIDSADQSVVGMVYADGHFITREQWQSENRMVERILAALQK